MLSSYNKLVLPETICTTVSESLLQFLFKLLYCVQRTVFTATMNPCANPHGMTVADPHMRAASKSHRNYFDLLTFEFLNGFSVHSKFSLTDNFIVK